MNDTDQTRDLLTYGCTGEVLEELKQLADHFGVEPERFIEDVNWVKVSCCTHLSKAFIREFSDKLDILLTFNCENNVLTGLLPEID